MARQNKATPKTEYTVKSEPKLNPDIGKSPDETIIKSENIPNLSADIRSSGDQTVVGISSSSSSDSSGSLQLNTDISSSQDVESVQYPEKELVVNRDINAAGNEVVSASISTPNLSADIQTSSNEINTVAIPPPIVVSADIQTSGDSAVIHSGKPDITVSADIQTSGDLPSIQLSKQELVVSADIQKSSNTQVVTPYTVPQLPTKIQNAPDLPIEFIEFPLVDGEWMPRGDPINIGPQNYSTLKNLRYTDYGLEGIGGTTRVNDLDTAITEGINNGIQLFNFTNDTSYVIIQDNDATHRDVFYSDAIVPAVEAAALTLAYEGTGTGLGRFALFPNGHVAMCNQNANVIWAGKEMRIGAFLGNYNDAAGLDWYTHRDDLTDFTSIVRNNVTSDDVAIDDDTGAAIGHTYFIGSPRPLDGFTVSMNLFNIAISTMTVNYFDGDDFTNNVAIDDGTSSGGVTLEQDGYVEFTADPTVYPYLMCGYYLYFYEVVISAIAGAPTISNITLDCDMQDMVDIWDGQYRTAILFYTYIDGVKKTLTAEMAAESNQFGSYYATITGMNSTDDELIVMFEEPQAGFKINMWEANVNAAANTIRISTWGEDSAWHLLAPKRDSTVDNAARTASFAKSGFILLDRPTTTEVKTTIDDITGYAYKITVATGTDLTDATIVDTIQGIPVYRTLNKPYIFPFRYQNRAMLCGNISENEENRADYSKSNTEAAFNGEDSSGYFNHKSLYFGGGDALTCAIEMLYHSSNQPTSSALFFKNAETYILDGYNADTFEIHKLSDNVGCPAPLTLDVSGIIVGKEDAPQRNIAIWMSNSGPMMYYDGVIRPIPGIEPYFERGNSLCIKDTLIDEARGWFDPEYNEYNLSIPSGTAATINNKWLTLDLTRMKWFEKDPSSVATTMFPEGAFPVEDTNGNIYLYGYCASVGYMMRLENGIVWTKTGGTSNYIDNELTTSDLLPSKSIWDETRLYNLQTIFKCSDTGDITISYYKDGKTTAETVTTLPTSRALASIDYENAGVVDYRIRHLISYLNLEAWSHRFNFKISNCETAANKPKLLGWGIAYQKRQNAFVDRDELRVITIDATHNTLSFTSSETIPAVLLDSADAGSYRIQELADELETKLNANDTLTGTGTITFVVTVSEGKLKIDSGGGNTIAFTQGQDGDKTFGFRTTQGAAQAVTADYYPEEEV